MATSPSGAWQRLHKVNQDLQSELEAQCQRQELITQQIQALKHSYGEAKDAIRHHEAEIRGLQARLGNAAAELAIKEQALAKLKGDLKLEKDKVREQLEGWQHSEATLSSQLQASEQKLKSAEALLLEKTQELRDLEVQQALQRDRQKEVQRLQERIAELSQQLSTSEQAQRLMEEKLQRNYELLLESCEKEKQVLLQNLKEVEDKASAYEDQLQDHEQQMEVLQKEKLSAKCEGSEVVHQLEEQLEMKEANIQKLAEHVQSLQEERDQVRQRFQELAEHVALSDGDMVALQEKLHKREADYQNLEHSYYRVAGQLQSMHTLLKEKEEELKHIKEVHEKVLEKKEQDLNEALVKMVALGSCLEETEMKLQAKEEILRKFASEPSEEVEEPKSTQEEAEVYGAGPPGLQPQPTSSLPSQLEEDPGPSPGEECGDGSPTKATPKAELPDKGGHSQSTAKPDAGVPRVKRQRIRFSTIQCQKYSHPESSEKAWTSSTSSDTSQDHSPSEESMSSEAAPSTLPMASDSNTYLSIIHSLETKLYITEEKLKDVTVKLESQQGQSQEALLVLHQQWAGAEARLREQLHSSVLQVGALASQLEQERQARAKMVDSHVGELGDFQVKNSQALACLESCREQLRSLPGASQEEAQDTGASPLASVERTLVSAIQALCHCAPVDSGAHAQLKDQDPLDKGQLVPQQPELPEEQQLKLLSDQITLEASLINQIAESLQNTSLDVSRLLQEITQARRWPLEVGTTAPCAGAPAEAWARKVLVDGEFWSRVESLSKHLGALGGQVTGAPAGGQHNLLPTLPPDLADVTWVRAELSCAMQSVRESFQQRLQSVQATLQGTQTALQQHKHMLGELLGAYHTPDFERVVQQVSDALDLPVSGEGGTQGPDAQTDPEAPSSQEPLPVSPHHPRALATIQEELALQLKGKANLLKEIAATLASVPTVDSVRDCQQFLQASRSLSCSLHVGGLSHYSSLLVQDAITQAQVCYAACRVRLEYEKELQCSKESWQSRGFSPSQDVRAAGTLREEYEGLLQKQKSEYLAVMAVIERENADLKAKVAQLDHQQHHHLEEVEDASALQGSYEQEVQAVVAQLNQVESTLQAEHSHILSQLDASARDRQDLERHHVQQMQTLEDRFQLKIRELQSIHEEELRALQEHYAQSLQRLQEALHLCGQQHPEALPAPGPPCSIWPASTEVDSMLGLRERVQELKAQMGVMREELEHKDLQGDAASLREKYQKDFESLKVPRHCPMCKPWGRPFPAWGGEVQSSGLR